MMADNDCVNRFSLGECDFGKPVTISVRSFLDFCGHRGQKFALSPLLSSKPVPPPCRVAGSM